MNSIQHTKERGICRRERDGAREAERDGMQMQLRTSCDCSLDDVAMRNLREILQESLNSAARSFNCGPKAAAATAAAAAATAAATATAAAATSANSNCNIAAMLLSRRAILRAGKLVFWRRGIEKSESTFFISPPPPSPGKKASKTRLVRAARRTWNANANANAFALRGFEVNEPFEGSTCVVGDASVSCKTSLLRSLWLLPAFLSFSLLLALFSLQFHR